MPPEGHLLDPLGTVIVTAPGDSPPGAAGCAGASVTRRLASEPKRNFPGPWAVDVRPGFVSSAGERWLLSREEFRTSA